MFYTVFQKKKKKSELSAAYLVSPRTSHSTPTTCGNPFAFQIKCFKNFNASVPIVHAKTPVNVHENGDFLKQFPKRVALKMHHLWAALCLV